MQPHTLDQSAHLRLCAGEPQRALTAAQPIRQHRQVDHQRNVGVGEVPQIDGHIALCTEGTDHRSPTQGLRAPILLPDTYQDGRAVGELDDWEKLLELAGSVQEDLNCPDRNPRKLGNMVTIEEVNDALREVIDPELGLDFVELGLIYGVEIDASGAVSVTYTLTTPGGPIGPQVEEQIQEFVGEIDGVSSVSSELVFTPPWSPDKMSEDAKFALGF
jgi:metal-sulfur cluster biosynthetic enzyme